MPTSTKLSLPNSLWARFDPSLQFSFPFLLLVQYGYVFPLANPEPTTSPRLPGEVKEKEHAGQIRHGRKSCGRWRQLLHMAKGEKGRQRAREPMASERTKPRGRRTRAVASEKGSWQNQHRGSHTVLIPASEPAAPTAQPQPQPQLQWTSCCVHGLGMALVWKCSYK